MTYAIGQIVYGVDLQEPSTYSGKVDAFAEFRDEIEELREMEVVESRYNGSGDEPMFIGANLGEIDEIKTILASDLIPKLTPTEAQRAEYQEAMVKLQQEATPACYDAIAAIEPYVFITWGSS